MITTFFIQMIAGLVTGFFSLLPAWGTSSSAVTGFSGQVSALASSSNGWVPEVLLFSCLALLVGVRLFFLAWRGAVFLYSMVPFN